MDEPNPTQELERLRSEIATLQQLLEVHDQTGLEQARKLEQIVEEYASILEATLDAVVAIDTDGRITAWNPQAEAIFGWPRAEALGRSLIDTIIPPQYHGAHQQGLQRFLNTGEGPVLNQRIEISALRRNGDEFPMKILIAEDEPSSRMLLSNRHAFSFEMPRMIVDPIPRFS